MTDQAGASEGGYVFTDRGHEQRRLASQALAFDPITDRVFRAAGIGIGMRVLDLGSGAGDVALLAARLVAPEGEVLGVDRDPEAVAAATDRVERMGVDNVRFIQDDAQLLEHVTGTFDAVVGRLVLVHLPDPVAALRRAAQLVRPGGIVCFHEGDMTYDWAYPMTPLWTQMRGWFVDALERVNGHPRMGLSLYQAYLAAGLPAPELHFGAEVGGGVRTRAWAWANVMVGVLPLLEKLGITTRAELDPDTLAERLANDVRDANGIVIIPPMFGAWTRTRG